MLQNAGKYPALRYWVTCDVSPPCSWYNIVSGEEGEGQERIATGGDRRDLGEKSREVEQC